jgi:hypothetical protein
MSANPFANPPVDSTPPTSVVSQASRSEFMEMARTTFLAWEKLRVVYVVVLGVLTLLLTGPRIIEIDILVALLFGGFVANVCYFAGPIVETYVRFLGYRGNVLRWLLFITGLVLTAILAVASLASMLLPNQN